MMAENEDLLDIEKLARHEFDLDVEEQRQLQSQCEVEVHKVGSYLVWSLLAKTSLPKSSLCHFTGLFLDFHGTGQISWVQKGFQPLLDFMI